MASRTGVFEILLFFVCLNLGCYFISSIGAIPFNVEGLETPESIMARFDITLFSSIAILIGGTFAGLLLNSVVQGAVIALAIAAINLVMPLLTWVLFGTPVLLALLGVPPIITTIISVPIAMVFFWFLIGLIAQRYME